MVKHSKFLFFYLHRILRIHVFQTSCNKRSHRELLPIAKLQSADPKRNLASLANRLPAQLERDRRCRAQVVR